MPSATASDVLIPGIMEHIERAGVHSGDSMAVYPPSTSTRAEMRRRSSSTRRGSRSALGVRGLINIQYVDLPRRRGPASTSSRSTRAPRRTVPFLSQGDRRADGASWRRDVMLGQTLARAGLRRADSGPAADWSRSRRRSSRWRSCVGVDTYLGPEMKSTGEVMGIDRRFEPRRAQGADRVRPRAQARARRSCSRPQRPTKARRCRSSSSCTPPAARSTPPRAQRR